MDSGVHSVCSRGDFAFKTVVGFLRKNSFEKCVTRWSILFICNTFGCWLVLLEFFVHWVSTGVLWEPRQCSLFGDYNPESEICFCTNLRRPSGPHAIRQSCSTVKRRGGCRTVESRWGATKNSAVALSARNNIRFMHQRSARANEGKITLILSYCVMNGFIMFGIMAWRPLHWRIRQSHLTYRQFHILVLWWRPRRIQPQRTRLSQSKNSSMDTWPIYKNYNASLVRKLELYKILIHVLIL